MHDNFDDWIVKLCVSSFLLISFALFRLINLITGGNVHKTIKGKVTQINSFRNRGNVDVIVRGKIVQIISCIISLKTPAIIPHILPNIFRKSQWQ